MSNTKGDAKNVQYIEVWIFADDFHFGGFLFDLYRFVLTNFELYE